MSKRIVFLFLFLSGLCFSQEKNDTLNQMIKGKKEGLWIQYLDSSIRPCAISKACYYRYIYYYHNKVNKSFLEGFSKKYSISYLEDRNKGREALPLNGTYVFTRKRKNKMQKFEETYENGMPLLFKQFEGNELFEFCDFKKTYNQIPGTFYVETGGKDKVKGYFRDGEKGRDFYFE